MIDCTIMMAYNLYVLFFIIVYKEKSSKQGNYFKISEEVNLKNSSVTHYITPTLYCTHSRTMSIIICIGVLLSYMVVACT